MCGPIAQLVQTNITRFGTIVMIIFLVSILTPLYRYNIRLATYYDAHGDILQLLDTKIGSVGFIDLAQALTSGRHLLKDLLARLK